MGGLGQGGYGGGGGMMSRPPTGGPPVGQPPPGGGVGPAGIPPMLGTGLGPGGMYGPPPWLNNLMQLLQAGRAAEVQGPPTTDVGMQLGQGGQGGQATPRPGGTQGLPYGPGNRSPGWMANRQPGGSIYERTQLNPQGQPSYQAPSPGSVSGEVGGGAIPRPGTTTAMAPPRAPGWRGSQAPPMPPPPNPNQIAGQASMANPSGLYQGNPLQNPMNAMLLPQLMAQAPPGPGTKPAARANEAQILRNRPASQIF